MRNFLVQTVQIEPRSVRIVKPNDTLRVRLPENSLVDLSSFIVRGAVVGIRAPGTNTQCILPRDSASLIQELTVLVNHTQVDNIRDYHHVAHLYRDMQEGLRFARNGVLRHNRDLIANNINLPSVGSRLSLAQQRGVLASDVPVSANATLMSGIEQNALPYAWQDFLGFLGQNRWIHTGYTGPIEVIIRFAGDEVVMSESSASTSSFQIQQLKAFINVATIEDSIFDEMMLQRLQNGGFSIPFKRYLTSRAPALRGSGSVPWSVVTKSLDAAYCVLLHPRPGRVAPVENSIMDMPLTDNDENVFFRRYCFAPFNPDHGWVRNAYCTVQGVQYPAFRADVDDWHHLALLTFRQHGNKYDSIATQYDRMNYVTWHSKESFFSYRWSWDARQDGTGVESGLDSQNLELFGTFEYDVHLPTIAIPAGQEFEVIPLVILETTSTLLVDPMRQLTVIA